MLFRLYGLADKPACIAIFAGNVPKFFAPREQAEFDAFLDKPNCTYFVVEDGLGKIIGCGGYYINMEQRVGALCWGMVANYEHHRGVGRYLLLERLKRICQINTADVVLIDTSQHTAPFFEKSGFVTQKIIKDHYAPGLHSYEMALRLDDARCGWLEEQES